MKIEKVSSEIDIEIVILRQKHRQSCYAQTCACKDAPSLMTPQSTPSYSEKLVIKLFFGLSALFRSNYFKLHSSKLPIYRASRARHQWHADEARCS
jgi:hypothetical protein